MVWLEYLHLLDVFRYILGSTHPCMRYWIFWLIFICKYRINLAQKWVSQSPRLRSKTDGTLCGIALLVVRHGAQVLFGLLGAVMRWLCSTNWTILRVWVSVGTMYRVRANTNISDLEIFISSHQKAAGSSTYMFIKGHQLAPGWRGGAFATVNSSQSKLASIA